MTLELVADRTRTFRPVVSGRSGYFIAEGQSEFTTSEIPEIIPGISFCKENTGSESWEQHPYLYDYDKGNQTALTKEETEEHLFIYVDGKVVRKTELVEYASTLSEKNRAAESAAKELIRSLLHAAPFPAKWIQEKIEKPSEECISHALSIADRVYDQCTLIPLRIAPTIEEGIILVYWNSSKGKSLKIEIYNTREVVGLVNQNKDIVSSLSILSTDNLNDLCLKFLS